MNRRLLRRKIVEFAESLLGQYVYEDGVWGVNPDGAQCVNLASMWARSLRRDYFPAGDAITWMPPVKRWQFEYNQPDNHPGPGNIVVIGPPAADAAGHVCIARVADLRSFTSLDQNFPDRSPVHWQEHGYEGVIGWFKPV